MFGHGERIAAAGPGAARNCNYQDEMDPATLTAIPSCLVDTLHIISTLHKYKPRTMAGSRISVRLDCVVLLGA